MTDEYNQRVYPPENHDLTDPNKALGIIREWDDNRSAPIAAGTFYKINKEIFDAPSRFEGQTPGNRMIV